jgi:TM2 domain-containing membrane protein YozV/Zn-finger nucleic acid-binding protein
MGVSYFIQRGTTVKGPFSKAQLKKLTEEKKLKKSDGFSKSADGPWEPFGSAYKQIFSSAPSPAKSPVPTIKAWKVKRGLLGKVQVNFKCPGCSNELKSDESDVLQQDYCSACGAGFMLGQEVADEIAVIRERIAEEKAAKDLENQQKKREKQKRRQEQQQRKQEEQERKQDEEERKQKQLPRKQRQQAELLLPAQPIVVMPSNPQQQIPAQYQHAPVLHQHAPVAYQPATAPVNVNIVVNQHTNRRWSRFGAIILSFLIPGLGQLYKGQVFNGIVWFVIVIIGYAALIIPGLILHLCCIVGAGMGNGDP